jgi:uncharacterized protein (DUF1330 family)
MSVIFLAVDTLTNVDLFREYQAAVRPILAKTGYEMMAYDEAARPLEGTPGGHRVVMIRFPSEEAFREFYDSEEYQAIIGKRLDATDGFALLLNG